MAHKSMLKIDIHTHILPKDIPDLKGKYGYGGFIKLDHHKPCCARMILDDGRFFREIESNCWDPTKRMEECDAHGVHVQVLSTVPVMFSYWAKPADTYDLSKILNDHIASIVRDHPRRFVGLGTLPMQEPELAIKELERCVKELGLAGVQIGSNINDVNLSDPALFPVFKAAEELGAAIFIHPWDMMGKGKIDKYWLPWLVGMPAECSRAICSLIFGGVLEKLPKLRVAIAHGGGSFPSTLGRIEHGFVSRPDLCAIDNDVNPREYLKRIYIDSLVHDPQVMRFIIEMFGAQRIALGSDYPFPLGEQVPGTLIESLKLSRADQEQLFYKTALEWLNKKVSDFQL